MDENVTRGSQEPNPAFPPGATSNGSGFTNSVFTVTLQNVNSCDGENQWYFVLLPPPAKVELRRLDTV